MISTRLAQDRGSSFKRALNAQLIKKYADAATDPLVYIAGPEPMVKSLAEQLGELGFDKDRVKLDDFPGYEEI